VEQVLAARTGTPAPGPALVPFEAGADPLITSVAADRLAPFVGTWTYPAPPLGLPAQTTVTITARDGHLVSYVPQQGTFRLYVQPDGSLHEEDSHARYLPVKDETGAVTGIADEAAIIVSALVVAARGDAARAQRMLNHVRDTAGVDAAAGRAVVELLAGDRAAAERRVRALAERAGAARVETLMNAAGYRLLRAELREQARTVFALNTRVFPEAFNTWDSLGEAYMTLGRHEDAIRAYQRSLRLNPDNANAEAMIARMRGGGATPRE